MAFPCIPSGAVTSGLVIIRIFQINSHLFPHPSLQGDFFNSSAIACSSILIVFTYKYKSQKKILTTEQEGQKYTNYSKVMIKESLLGTRRYLSRGGGGKGGRGWEDFGGIVWLSGGTRGSGGGWGGGGRYRKLTAKEGGPLLGLLLTIDSCFNKLVMHIIRGHCS